MKIYLFMCLNEVVDDVYYTDEEIVKDLVEQANKINGGDFWYKEMHRAGMNKEGN